MLRLCLTCIFLFSFSDKLMAADVARGEKLFAKCVACHGKTGMGKKSQKAPMLAGQFDWYIEQQILAIKNGTRSNNHAKKMIPYVKNLSESDKKEKRSHF